MALGNLTLMNAGVSALVSLIPLIGIAAGLNGFVASENTRLKTIAMTGELSRPLLALRRSCLRRRSEARQMSPRFDPTINLGHVITLAGFIFAMRGGWYMTDHRLSSLERNFDRLSTVVIDNARTDERLKEHGRRLDRLESKP